MDSELQKWLDVWEKSLVDAPMPPSEPVQQPNYGYQADVNDELMNDSVNVAYAGSEGFGRHVDLPKLSNKPGKKVLLNNPVAPNSIGDNQEKTYVTDNWSDGEELRELDAAKRELEQLEREVHVADILEEKSKFKKLQEQLGNLKKKIYELNYKIIPVPGEDLA